VSSSTPATGSRMSGVSAPAEPGQGVRRAGPGYLVLR
jgi:hypothetical protein